LFVVFAGEKQPKHVGKMPEIWKKFDSEVITTVFKKIRQNAQILKSRSRSVWWSLGLVSKF